MRKLWVVAVFTLFFAATAVADLINFNFTLGDPTSVTATAAGLVAGPSTLTSISDSTKSTIVPFAGTFVTATTGPAISLTQFGTIVIGTFTAGGTNSVLVEDSMGNVLVSGSTDDVGSLLSTVSNGTGSFLATFRVTSISPAALALFGLGPGFLPNGVVVFTIGNTAFDGTTYTAAIGGGAVTIQTPTAVPEPTGLGILGMGLLMIAGGFRRWQATQHAPWQ